MVMSNLPTSKQKTIPSRRIVDATVRLFHLGAAVCFTGAYLTADSEQFQAVHVSLGYTLLGLVVFRIVWGLVGPRQARLSILGNKLKAMSSWRDAVITRSIQWRQVRQVILSGAVLSILAGAVPLTLTGYATYMEWGGDWIEELHELWGNVLLSLVVLHIGLVLLMRKLKTSQAVRPMWSGRIEGIGPDVAKHNHLWLALCLGAAIVVFWVSQWLQK